MRHHPLAELLTAFIPSGLVIEHVAEPGDAAGHPDGNLVELTQLGPSWLDHLKAHRAVTGDLVSRWNAHLTA